MTAPPPEAFFLDAGPGRQGQRFCLYHAAARVPASGMVVQVHAFAEEMNKSRRMAALQSRAFAAHGFAVLQIDLLGCGDSSGDFNEATWEDWIVDVLLAAGWLRERVGAPLWLWGIRAGALLACDVAARLDVSCNFIFWQPALADKSVHQQFLRLKAAASLGEGQMKATLDEARARLARGEDVEIAGYCLSARLAGALLQARHEPPATPGRVAWLETSSRQEPTLGPAALDAIARWRAAGHAVQAHAVAGPMFWQTVEIEVAPALLAASVAAVSGGAGE